MASRIVVTDIHGCAKTLAALVAQFPTGIPISVAGDLVDRGPDSCGVIEIVKNAGWDCVRGNHEQMMIDELTFGEDDQGKWYHHKSYFDGDWARNGAEETLDSYVDKDTGVVDIVKLQEHYDWMKALPLYFKYDDVKNAAGQALLVSHSSPARVWNLPHDQPHFQGHIQWSRDHFPPKIQGYYNVFGHTIQNMGKARIEDHFAIIDTGASIGKAPYGKLTALQFPEMIQYVQEYCE